MLCYAIYILCVGAHDVLSVFKSKVPLTNHDRLHFVFDLLLLVAELFFINTF